jgi:hypothetical protein
MASLQTFAQTPSDTTLVGKKVRIQTSNGDDIRGVITAENEINIQIRLDDSTVFTVPKIKIASFEVLEEDQFNPLPDSLFQGNHKLYFLNYSALPFEGKSGQFDVSLFGTQSVSMNLSPRFSIAARNMFFKGFDFSGLVSIKVKDHLYAGIHFGWLARYSVFFPNYFDEDDWGFNVNLKFTIGTNRKNFTIGAGGFSSIFFGHSSKVLTFSGMYPLRKRVLIVGDGSFMLDNEIGGYGIGIKFLGKTDWSIDLGFGHSYFPKTSTEVIPYYLRSDKKDFFSEISFPFIGFHKKF